MHIFVNFKKFSIFVDPNTPSWIRHCLGVRSVNTLNKRKMLQVINMTIVINIPYPGLETEAINTNQQIHSALQRANLV